MSQSEELLSVTVPEYAPEQPGALPRGPSVGALAAPPASWAPGAILADNIVLGYPIGRGGMEQVYRELMTWIDLSQHRLPGTDQIVVLDTGLAYRGLGPLEEHPVPAAENNQIDGGGHDFQHEVIQREELISTNGKPDIRGSSHDNRVPRIKRQRRSLGGPLECLDSNPHCTALLFSVVLGSGIGYRRLALASLSDDRHD